MKQKKVVVGATGHLGIKIVKVFLKEGADIKAMIRWIHSGVYASKNQERQMNLFGYSPAIEEGVIRYCKEQKLL